MGTSSTQDRLRTALIDMLRRWDLLDGDVGAGESPRPLTDGLLNDLGTDLADAARQVVREIMAETF